ncbi:ferric-dicitrate binding protein FerR (iron transport regulator) [Dyadobacter sp. BE34]|uniref:Ferric-dicitrate binding protein FerR (Iron transport regulator) n=1 Tax=Dyadobacter fermentans TaxID=94254 RepID=A0ABU1QT69_9BACT|nr:MULTISPECIES: FecR domain-containing protein [Dyadobacter]MDR6804358.1 ferric-dicitrate binding protein FerR (iron transport regulator) [Dyadobacter fermentans]MDR7042098.1 ferric-dicitrate binding protein FerR (iron transport regulator) [Dyadobacter sp. BE242]MDR7196501.1 ferric-dicitrate binding protein FerR (iron transport regulator) [Dyadobacter sp. BE34]MDR7212954.1 ferric-dicitrate binding protein FerR (iron transport regulator) [Dyadobacter sp. BE31]MDR7261907.1 ferric-dicitrate bind
MDKDRLLYLLENDKSGQNSRAEAEELEAWYRSAELRPAFTDGLSADGLSALEDRLFARIQTVNAESQEWVDELPAGKSGWFGWGKIAAAVLFLMVAGIGLYIFQRQSGRITERTGFGETRVLTLPDGSEVTLNGNSVLSYDAEWSELREVRLEGEGYFKVVHTKDHRKFRVRTGADFSLDVLGTQFNVSKRESGTRIVLDEGKVRCNLGDSESDTLVLRPGEMVQFRKKPSDYQHERVEKGLYSAWKDHKLIFKNTSLREVAGILRDTYGLETEASRPELLDRQISGSVPTDNVDLLLQGVAEASNVTITRDGEQLVIASRSE